MIDKNIPIPEPRRGLLDEYKIKDLKVGESVLVPKEFDKQIRVAVAQHKIRTGKAYTVRGVDESNLRVWRTE